MSKQQEALQFLDDLDAINVPSTSKTNETSRSKAAPSVNEAEALAFLDEITQKSSESTRTTTPSLQPRTVTPRASSRISLRKGVDGVTVSRSSSPAPHSGHGRTSSTTAVEKTVTPAPSPPPDQSSNGNSWGWGSVWSTASAAVKQARSVVDEQVKNLPKNEQAKKWSEGMLEYVKNAQLDKIGQDFKSVSLSTFNDILNVVAPPISEHEVIQVLVSHDMRGYDGVESLVYQALAKVMEQVEGGDLVVNKGDESRPKDHGKERNLGGVEGFEAALKLAQADIDDLIKIHSEKKLTKQSGATNPVTYSQVYLRIQPYLTTLPPFPTVMPSEKTSTNLQGPTHLVFLIYLSSSQSITHYTTTQIVPYKWVEAFEAEDATGKGVTINAWVEDVLVDALRVGLEVVGQEYIAGRMGWGKLQAEGNEEDTPQVSG